MHESGYRRRKRGRKRGRGVFVREGGGGLYSWQAASRWIRTAIGGMDGRVQRSRGRRHRVGSFELMDEAAGGGATHRHCARQSPPRSQPPSLGYAAVQYGWNSSPAGSRPPPRPHTGQPSRCGGGSHREIQAWLGAQSNSSGRTPTFPLHRCQTATAKFEVGWLAPCR